MVKDSFCIDVVSPRPGARVVAYDLVIGIPAFAFLIYLGWNLKNSLKKLRHSQSHIMATYYTFLWTVTLFNLLRCVVQIAQTARDDPVAWNVMWLFTRFGMVLLEVSVVVFLLQGYLYTGQEALRRTLMVSGGVAAFDTFVKAIYIFAVDIPLFLYGGSGSQGIAYDMKWSKWCFWFLHSMLFSVVYGIIVALPFTKWRDVLPAKASFYRYVDVLLILNILSAVGSLLIGSKVVAGYCVYGVANWIYYAAYPVLLYITFLREFFADDQLDLDLMYYSEMREAGFLQEDYGDGSSL